MQKVIRATVLIASFSIISKLLGAARQAVFANQFGTGIEMDIYIASFRLPDLFFNLLIIGTLSVAFIPIFVSYMKTDQEEAYAMAGTVFNATIFIMGILGIVGAIFAGLFVDIIVPGFSGEARQQVVLLTRVMMLSPLLFSMSSVMTSVLHANNRFLLAAVAPLLYNLSIIAGVFFLYPNFGLVGIAWGVVFGAFLHFIVQLPKVISLGFNPFRKRVSLQHSGLRKIGKLFLPRIFGVDLGQISLLIASIIGSTLSVGSLSVFYFAFDLQTVPLGIFAISFAVASFPVMSEYFVQHDVEGFKKYFSQISVQILFFIIPISVLLLLLRAQSVRLVLGIGENTAFDFESTRQTAQALGFFALSLFSQSLIPILARSFYALQNTMIPVLVSIFSALVNVIAAIYLVKIFEAGGLALAFSIASFINMVLLMVLLRQKIGDFYKTAFMVRMVKISISAIVMAIFTFLTLYTVAPLVNMQTYIGVFIQTVSALAVAVAVYLLTGLLINLPEAWNVAKLSKRWFTKFTRPVSSVIVNMFTDIS